MALSEIDIIRRYFTAAGARRGDVAVGVGDDAAVVDVPAGQQLVLAMDTLVSGVHFPEETRAEDIGYKALAVNLSDLAAMGAEPAWATLALTAPRNDPAWLAAFAGGFSELARAAGVQLIGGDTTRGPLTVTVQVHGLVSRGEAVLRSAAREGDVIYVTGTLGDAALALRRWRAGLPVTSRAERQLAARLDRPTPRIEAGRALRGLAHAMIDISDGLAADLGHILAASGAGATITLDALPLSAAFEEVAAAMHKERAAEIALTGGDDYELCFTVAAAHCAEAERRLAAIGCGYRAIGLIEAAAGLRVRDRDGASVAVAVGVWLCDVTGRHLGVGDHPGMVWDEMVGYWIAIAALPPRWEWWLAAVVVFRIFDIWKPWPIGELDRRLHGGLGVMVDDAVAGLLTGAILFVASHWIVFPT